MPLPICLGIDNYVHAQTGPSFTGRLGVGMRLIPAKSVAHPIANFNNCAGLDRQQKCLCLSVSLTHNCARLLTVATPLVKQQSSRRSKFARQNST